ASHLYRAVVVCTRHRVSCAQLLGEHVLRKGFREGSRRLRCEPFCRDCFLVGQPICRLPLCSDYATIRFLIFSPYGDSWRGASSLGSEVCGHTSLVLSPRLPPRLGRRSGPTSGANRSLRVRR